MYAPFRILILFLFITSNSANAQNNVKQALSKLRNAESGTASQAEIQAAWHTVTSNDSSTLFEILTAMRGTKPIAENWLRGAVDTIAERQLRATGSLPNEKLEKFVLSGEESPRARRTAYEWLLAADDTAEERLLPKMLDDSSLELRYDAVARLIDQAASAEESAKQNLYKRALSSARSLDQMSACIDQLEKLGEKPNLETYFSYVTRWMIIGPFDNTAGVGMSNAYPPEEELDFTKKHQGKSNELSWLEYQPTAEDLGDVGRVDLNSVLQEEKGVVAYAAAKIYSANKRIVQCRYETVNASEFWFNGDQLAAHNIYHSGGEFDQYVVPVTLQPGENIILLKVCQNEQTEVWARPWNFRLRVTDDLGAGIELAYEPQ